MNLHEVKIGDLVSFKNKKGKQVTGKVIYRHDGKDNAALMGHVNVQIDDEGIYPETVHVSKLKKSLKEEFSMANLNENIRQLVSHIVSGNNIDAQNTFTDILGIKVSQTLDTLKPEVAQNMFATESCEECNEEVLSQEEFDALSEEEQAEYEPIEIDDEEEIDFEDEEELDEAVQLDELSNKTLKGYMKKRLDRSQADWEKTQADIGTSGPPGQGKQRKDKAVADLNRRQKGMARAYELTKEDVEQIDELSTGTLQSYVQKRNATAAQADRNMGKAQASGNTSAIKKANTTQARRVKGMATASKTLSNRAAGATNEAVVAPKSMKAIPADAAAKAKADMEAAKKKREAVLASAKAELMGTSKDELKKSLKKHMFKKED